MIDLVAKELKEHDSLLNLVEDPSLVIVHSIVLDGLMDEGLLQAVDDLNVIEVDNHTPAGAARDVRHFVCLDCYLHVLEGCHQRELHVIARFRYRVQQGTPAEVDAYMAFLDYVEAIEDDKYERREDPEHKDFEETHYFNNSAFAKAYWGFGEIGRAHV